MSVKSYIARESDGTQGHAVSYYFDIASDTNVGSLDTYAAGGQTPNQSAVVTDIAIDEPGRHDLKFETTGKNASSAGYYVLLCGEWSLWKTD